MKRIKIIIATAIIIVLCPQGVFGAAPHDIQRHWAGNPIHTMMENNIMNGYPDGRFRPDHSLTRAAAAKILAGLIQQLEQNEELNNDAAVEGQDSELNEKTAIEEQNKEPNEETVSKEPNEEPDEATAGMPEEAAELSFMDVKESHWAWPSIQFLAQRGIINGYPDGSFRPEEPVTRAQFTFMIYGYIAPMKPEWKTMADFSDIRSSFAEEAIRILGGNGVVNGYPNGTFRPDVKILRGEAAKILLGISEFEITTVEVTLPSYNVIPVPYISQLSPVRAVVGCEATSLLMGLKGKGYATEVDLRTFLDGMPKHTSNPAKGFVGSPYIADPTKKTRTTIYPAKLVEYASRYGKVQDFSGSSPAELQGELLAGNPVVIYATMRWEKPFYRTYNIEGETQRLLSNNHAVLVCGYNCENNQYYIADPYNDQNTSKEYRYWISGSTLEPIYNERRHAIVVE